MSAQGNAYVEKVISMVVPALFLLASAFQSVTLADDLKSTLSPTVSQPMLITQALNESMEYPAVLRSHTPCREEHANYCQNDGQCMYPQDTDSPSCTCIAGYTGVRCMFLVSHTYTPNDYEAVIGITMGVVLMIFVLAAIYLCIRKRCKKSVLLIKSHGSQISV